MTLLALGGCGSTSTSSSSDESAPTFEQAEAIAKEQLTGQPCKFQVSDDSTDTLESKKLECLTKVSGEPQLLTIFQYTNDLETSEDYGFGGFTTATHYFSNGNITVDPSGGDPTAIQLDAEQFATAIKDDCGCGEVKTPES